MGLIPTNEPTTPQEAVDWLLDLDAVQAITKGRQDSLRSYLETTARTIADMQGGGGYTARLDGAQVILTNPAPTAKVTDRDALTDWMDEHTPHLVVRTARLDLRPDADLYAMQRLARRWLNDGAAGDATALAEQVLHAIVWSDPAHIPEEPISALEEGGHVHVLPFGVVADATGEVVPGTEVTQAPQRLQVRLDKQTRTRVADRLRATLGMEGEA